LTSGAIIHKTAAANERVNKLWCYACDTMDDGQACVDVVIRNDSTLMKKCEGEEFICMVSRHIFILMENLHLLTQRQFER